LSSTDLTAANTIFANESSTVGSIATTMSFLSQVEKDKKDGYAYVQLSSGQFKDMFSPDKPMTKED
jgi:ClpP class serine protease